MENMSYGVHKPKPGKMHTTGKHHLASGPAKTGQFSSGGGTAPGHGKVKKGMRKRSAFRVPQPDEHGYY